MSLMFWGALRENVEKEDKKSLAELGVSRTPNYNEGKANLDYTVFKNV